MNPIFYPTANDARKAGMTWYCGYCETNQDECDCTDILDYRPFYGEYLGKETLEIPYEKFIEIHIELNKYRKSPWSTQEVIDHFHRHYEDYWIDGELEKESKEYLRVLQKIRDNFPSDNFPSDFSLIKANVILHPGGFLGSTNFDSLDGKLTCRDKSVGANWGKISLFEVTRPNGETYVTEHYCVVLKDFENHIKNVETFSLPVDLGITEQELLLMSKNKSEAYLIHYSRNTAQSTIRNKYKFPHSKYSLT